MVLHTFATRSKIVNGTLDRNDAATTCEKFVSMSAVSNKAEQSA